MPQESVFLKTSAHKVNNIFITLVIKVWSLQGHQKIVSVIATLNKETYNRNNCVYYPPPPKKKIQKRIKFCILPGRFGYEHPSLELTSIQAVIDLHLIIAAVTVAIEALILSDK